MDVPKEYIMANGPDGLRHVLDTLLETSQKDPLFAKQEHVVMYQLGNQKSIIKVDTSRTPFVFWHYDLMGRPATVAIKDTIKQFLQEKWGVTE